MPEGVDHQTYVVQGIVDGAVAKKQAEVRHNEKGEVTIVHNHARGDHALSGRIPCNTKCRKFNGQWEPVL